MCKIGVLSDTHGLLRPEVIKYVEDCNVIMHAGDIGSCAILKQLGEITNVYAVRGNNDQEMWAMKLPSTVEVTLGKRKVYMIHDINGMTENVNDYDVIISGHSHNLSIYQKKKQLYINPGAAGKCRFGLPLTMVKLELLEKLKIEVITI